MKILVGYKGTNVGRDLMEIAAQHAKAFEGDIIVVTSMMSGDSHEQEKINNAEKNLEKAESFFKALDITCESHLLIRGLEAGDDIVKFAKEKQVDEIIMGVRSRSKVGKLIFGSTAQAVILEAHCPVLTVK